MIRSRHLLVILAVALGTMAALARSDEKQWSDGPLHWDDFKGSPALLTVPSAMSVELNATPSVEGEGNGRRISLAATATMYRDRSAVQIGVDDPQRLRYHQLQFDLLEYYRRRLQDEINEGRSGMEVEQRLKYYREEYRSRVQQIERETENGANDHRLQDWEYTVRRQLDELGLPPVPRVSPGKWSYGIMAGVGVEIPTGQLADNFKTGATFMIGLTGGYRDLRLKADIAYSQPGISNPNIFNVPDSAGYAMQGNANSSATHLMVGVQLGYTVLKLKRLTVTPNVGLHYSVYSWETEDYTWPKNDQGEHYRLIKAVERRKLHSVGWMASIDFDIALASHVTNTPILGGRNREQFTSSLRITPWVARASYDKCDPARRGYSLGVTVAYLGLGRLLSF